VRVILRLYGLTCGSLVMDDTDKSSPYHFTYPSEH
jgi:hypothetical protein